MTLKELTPKQLWDAMQVVDCLGREMALPADREHTLVVGQLLEKLHNEKLREKSDPSQMTLNFD